ncbi:MAG: WYL domain-containing protein [Desulfobacterales bacterium]|uniref:WYL domain-containing protein n=1 Tax=Candidatus Desulfatibia vada TaxID=2841696 RepID=A0A8J6TS74_9BACT|nr:WYL domain-containing protein [Candidatus Desulfatibia vada]
MPEVPQKRLTRRNSGETRRYSGAIRAQKNKIRYKADEKFEMSCDFNLDEYTKHCFKVIHDELYTVKVCITSAWARYIGEKIWHESQRSRKLRDGSLTRFSHETERLICKLSTAKSRRRGHFSLKT